MAFQLLSRREFLRRSFLGAAAAGCFPAAGRLLEHGSLPLGRITAASVQVWNKPGKDAESVYQFQRDQLVQLYQPIEVDGYRNPLWYRVWGGYIHSARVQPVEFNYQPFVADIPETGCLFEVSVPYTRSYRLERGE